MDGRDLVSVHNPFVMHYKKFIKIVSTKYDKMIEF